MEIREITMDNILVLAPDGSITGSEETTALETKLGTALKTGVRLLVLDCSGVGQLTGAAIRVLLMTSRKLDPKGRLVLCGMNAKVQKAFSISGFDKDFNVVVTREEALRRVIEPVQPRALKTPKAPPAAKRRVVEEMAPPEIAAAPETEAPSDVAPAAVHPAPAVKASDAGPIAPDDPVSESDGHDALVAAILDTLGKPHLHLATAVRPVRRDLEDVAIGVLAALRAHV